MKNNKVTNEVINEIRTTLEEMADPKNRDFLSKLIPNIDKETILGIKSGPIKKYTKEIIKNGSSEVFIDSLPHKYFEENMLHINILCSIKDYDLMMEKLKIFVPYIDNWAVNDSFSSKTMEKNLDKTYPYLESLIKSDKPYDIRFGTIMLMKYYLSKENFNVKHIKLLSKVKNDDYYVKMGIAWYLSYALIKQYDRTLPFIQKPIFEKWTHNKAIQKARESLRIDKETKDYLNTLKIKS